MIQKIIGDWSMQKITANATIARATIRLNRRCPANTNGAPVINSCSLAKAITEPVKVIAPITMPTLTSMRLIRRISPSTAM